MTTSDKGLDIIKRHEGFRSKPYLCPSGVPTIGYGNTFYQDGRKVTLQDKPITEAEAAELMRDILKKFEKDIMRLVSVKLTQNQFDALVSFVYNVGVGSSNPNIKGGFTPSTLRKKINANPSDPTIAAEFARWNKGGGKVLPGLVKRRKEEAELYFT